jgi:hypothetical protein
MAHCRRIALTIGAGMMPKVTDALPALRRQDAAVTVAAGRGRSRPGIDVIDQAQGTRPERELAHSGELA